MTVDSVAATDGQTAYLAKARVPVSLISGFLGAGKTTLLNRLLGASHGRRIAVLVNDFNDLNIDAALIAERSSDVIALHNGCICCSMKEDFAVSVVNVARRTLQPEHILIESSGVSDPVAIAEALYGPLLEPHIRVDSIIAVLDASQYPDASFEDSERALTQSAIADLVVINKVDIASEIAVRRLIEDIEIVSPAARIIQTSHCAIPAELVIGVETGARRTLPLPNRHYHDAVDHGFVTWSWTSAVPLRLEALQACVQSWPKTVYRAKGWVELLGYENPSLFQMVGKRSNISVGVPSPRPGSTIVFVGRANLNEQQRVMCDLDDCCAGAVGSAVASAVSGSPLGRAARMGASGPPSTVRSRMEKS